MSRRVQLCDDISDDTDLRDEAGEEEAPDPLTPLSVQLFDADEQMSASVGPTESSAKALMAGEEMFAGSRSCEPRFYLERAKRKHRERQSGVSAREDVSCFSQRSARATSTASRGIGVSRRISRASWPFARLATSLANSVVTKRTIPKSMESIDPGYDQTLSLLEGIFEADEAACLKQQHISLGRVARCIFALSGAPMPSRPTLRLVPTVATLTGPKKGQEWHCSRMAAARIIGNRWFTGFFLTLTIYALFGTDILAIYGNRELDVLFRWVNTGVFLLFFIELILTAMGRRRYLPRLPFWLDCIALFSIVSDTWFVQLGGSGDKDSITSQLVMARSARMTRLTRVVRVARVARLIPYLTRLLGREKISLTRQLMRRRLHRLFQYLDVDRSGRIACFDVKCVYVTLVEDCSDVLQAPKEELVRADLDVLSERLPSSSATFTFAEFYKLIQDLALGRCLERAYLEELEHDEGSWALTRVASDNMSMKVCCGMILICVLVSLLDSASSDQSPEQCLWFLDFLVRREFSCVVPPCQSNAKYICQQIGNFARKFVVLFLQLNGSTYVDQGVCNPTPRLNINALDRMDDIAEQLNMRAAQVLKLCIPFDDKCRDGSAVTSAVLIDQEQAVKDEAVNALIMTCSAIGLLLLFVFVFNKVVGAFSNALLHPLRVLVDDMVAMSSLELLCAEADSKSAGESASTEKPIEVAEGLERLWLAFGAMHANIRSWSKFVPPAVVQRLLANQMEAELGVRKVVVTVLFVDIVDFDDVCMDLSAPEVLALLEKVFGIIAGVVHSNHGTLLEFIGDEVLAVYGAPVAMRRHQRAAVDSALEIHEALASSQAETDSRILKLKVGVHTAQVLAGNIGSKQRMKYGLLGDGVNLTARLKGLNTRYGTQTLVTDAIMAEEVCRRRYLWRPVDVVAVKGRTQPTTVYEVIGLRKVSQPGQLSALRKHNTGFDLYLKRNFDEAKALFQEVASHCDASRGARDEASHMMISRCRTYIQRPPPPDWDGVERLTKKTFAFEEESNSSSSEKVASVPREESNSSSSEKVASVPSEIFAAQPPMPSCPLRLGPITLYFQSTRELPDMPPDSPTPRLPLSVVPIGAPKCTLTL